MPFFYGFSVWCVTALLNIFSSWRVIGLERVPLRGPLLVVSNHQSNADPNILIGIMPRAIHFMAKREVFRWPLGTLARGCGAFPVRRGQSDRQAIKTALDFLARGSCVGMFPEGTRSRTGGLIQGQTGAGLLAIRSGAPILPIGVVGTGRLQSPLSVLQRPRIDIIIGEPFALQPHTGPGMASAAVEATETMMLHIAALLPPTMRGKYRAPDLVAAPGAADRF